MQYIVSEHLEKNLFFFSAVGLNSELKTFIKPCCKYMCIHPGFVVPLTEHRQSRLSLTLKIPGCSPW